MITQSMERTLVMAIFIVGVLLPLVGNSAPAVPSQWVGEITGQVQNRAFRLPLTIELRPPLPFENNPLHLFIGTGDSKEMGSIYLVSAQRFNTQSGTATLQYLSIAVGRQGVEARLTNTGRGEAAAVNSFSGPNVSAAEASELMRGILQQAWGSTEMFAIHRGGTLILRIDGNRMSGTIRVTGSSYTGTSSTVNYAAQISTTRVK